MVFGRQAAQSKWSAIERADGSREWWLDDNQFFNEQDFNNVINIKRLTRRIKKNIG